MIKALVRGLNNFLDPRIPKLNGCVNDAVLLSTELRNFYGAQVRLLTDEYATFDAHMDRFDWLTDGATEEDTLILAGSSHGTWTVDKSFDERDYRDEVFVCYDHKPKEVELTDDIIEKVFENCPAKVIHIIDTCHAGTAFRNGSNLTNRYLSPPADIENRVLMITGKKPKQDDNIIAISACHDNEYALGLPSKMGGNGLFTLSLFQAINKFKHKGSVKEIFYETRKNVVRIAKTLGAQQTPVLTCPDKYLEGELF